jgi:HTH-type transcriptional regulator/antitoxin MqsA
MSNKCPVCGTKLLERTKTEEFKYKGQTTELRTFLLVCNKCLTETVLNAEDIPKQKERFKLSVDGYLTDIDIKRIRRNLGLSQEAMGKKLRVGLKNFARYESLGGHQSKAMDDLLRILEVYPEAIKVLEGLQKGKKSGTEA